MAIEELTYAYDDFIRTLYIVILWLITFGMLFVFKMIKGGSDVNSK